MTETCLITGFPSKSDPGYDIIEDFPLIEASFSQQYGIRLSREMDDMSWGEFVTLLCGLNEFTPLGSIVRVRLETDSKVIKSFNASQRKIHNDWKKKKLAKMSEEEIKESYKAISEAFLSRV